MCVDHEFIEVYSLFSLHIDSRVKHVHQHSLLPEPPTTWRMRERGETRAHRRDSERAQRLIYRSENKDTILIEHTSALKDLLRGPPRDLALLDITVVFAWGLGTRLALKLIKVVAACTRYT